MLSFLAILKLPNFIYCICYLSCRVNLKKSGTRTPRVEVTEMGPSYDFTLRRSRLASDDLYKTAIKQPKALKVCGHFTI